MRACQPQRHKPEDSVFATDAVSFLTLKVYPEQFYAGLSAAKTQARRQCLCH
jgi:hypothetical protein